MHILATGGSGLIYSHIADWLLTVPNAILEQNDYPTGDVKKFSVHYGSKNFEIIKGVTVCTICDLAWPQMLITSASEIFSSLLKAF